MARGRAQKELMAGKDKQGFPKVPEKDKFADDIGFFTKAKALPKRLRGK